MLQQRSISESVRGILKKGDYDVNIHYFLHHRRRLFQSRCLSRQRTTGMEFGGLCVCDHRRVPAVEDYWVIIAQMELPDRCNHCHQEHMVDMENLESRPLSGLYFEHGYLCSTCGRWKPCHVSTRSLDDKLQHLSRMRPDHPSFRYYFVKAYKRAQEIQRHGSIRHPNMAESG